MYCFILIMKLQANQMKQLSHTQGLWAIHKVCEPYTRSYVPACDCWKTVKYHCIYKWYFISRTAVLLDLSLPGNVCSIPLEIPHLAMTSKSRCSSVCSWTAKCKLIFQVMDIVGCRSCVPATSWAGPKHTNLFMFPGFHVKKFKANRTKEALTTFSVFRSVWERSQGVLWDLCALWFKCSFSLPVFLLFSYCPYCYI